MQEQAATPKTSQLGWNMDHQWLVRDGRWSLQGEVHRSDAGWSPVRAQVEISDGLVRFAWESDAGPASRYALPDRRRQGEAFEVSIATDSDTLPGRLEARGASQFLFARTGSTSWTEIARQLPDGTVEVVGTLHGVGNEFAAWRWTLVPEATEESWSIPASVIDEIVAAAHGGAPVEQCGLLVGRPSERSIERQIGMANVDQSEDHFTIDPREQLKATKSLRGSGSDIVGFWHSHPFSPARLSDEDLAFAQDETSLYGIASLMDPAEPKLNIWKVEGGRPRLVPLRVLPDIHATP